MISPASEDTIVFNVVWTGSTFASLGVLVESQIHHSNVRFRFLANACEEGQLEAMEEMASRHPDRITEIRVVSNGRMISHGAALDSVLPTCVEAHFGLMDPDIYAVAPFMRRFLDSLTRCDVVTSGREVWSSHNTRPAGHLGVPGEFFYDQDGFCFGSPHLAIYDTEVARETSERWGVGFGTRGNDVSPRVRARLEQMGRAYWVYDTGKVLNILLQGDGCSLEHIETPEVVHIGGVSHFLAPPGSAPAVRHEPPQWGEGAEWGQDPGMRDRYEVASYTARLLMELLQGGDAPPVPDVASHLVDRLETVRSELIDIVARHRPVSSRPGGVPR